MGRRPATPSAMVLVGPVVTTRRWRHEYVGLQRLAAVQRSVEENRVDHLASRPDPGSVEARLLHDTAA
jgi:hypothetical protein